MQPWYRWREPLAVVLLVVLALMLVVRGVSLGLALAAGNAGGMVGSLPGGDELLLLAAAAAVLWCTTPVGDVGSVATDQAPSPHAWPIAVAGLVVVGLTVLGWLVLAVWNVVAVGSSPGPDAGLVLFVIDGLLRLALPIAALVAAVSAVRRAAAARGATDAQPVPTAASGEIDADVPAVSTAPERLPAAWQADEATGAVWLTADDAARGQPGLSWSDPAAIAGAAASGPWGPTPPRAGESVASTDPTAIEDDDLR